MSDQKQLHRDTIGLVRAFACPVCGSFAAFEATACSVCAAAIGLHPPSMTMFQLGDEGVDIDGRCWIRCTQSLTLGCNWLVPEDGDDAGARGRCLPDSLIRREPDASDTVAREKLVPTAQALRRLIYQLLDLGLPVRALPMRWNFPNDPIADRMYPQELEHVVFLHYLRGQAFRRDRVFADAQAFARFLDRPVEGSNAVFQRAVARITGGRYPFPG